MELEDQVVSLQLAKKLKKLGFKQESLHYYYFNAGEYTGAIVDGYGYKDTTQEFKDSKLVSAYTVAELGEILPHLLWLKGRDPQDFDGVEIYYYDNRWFVKYEFSDKKIETNDVTEANARAKMLIYLKENNLI